MPDHAVALEDAVEPGPAVSGAESMDGEHHELPGAPVPAEQSLPVDTLRDAAPFLRRPFTKEAVHFKIQAGVGGSKKDNKPPTGGIIVAHLDARLIVERLNAVCPHLWWDEYERLDETHLLCRLTVDGVTRVDVGEWSSGGGLEADPVKSRYSDALKRAAVKFGIGVSIYAMQQVFLPVGPKGLELTAAKKLRLPDTTLDRLRSGYEKWLQEGDGRKFGEPLDHGDTLTPIAGEAFEDTEQPADESEGGPVEGPEADELRGQIVAVWDELRGLPEPGVTPAEYGAMRRGAEGSVEDLAALLSVLSDRLAEAKGVAS